MSDVYVFPPDAEDFTTMGLVGALIPTECTFSETANGESIVEMTHPLDDFGRYTALEKGNILVVPVPVRTTPEIEDGHCVTTVWSYKVKPLGQLTHKNQCTLFKTATGKAAIKVMKPGDLVTVVKTFPEEDDVKRWKVKCKYGTGFVDPAGFELVTEHKIPDNSQAIEEIQSPWSVMPQFFRIYEVKKSIDSVDVSARHISYDLLYNLTKYESRNAVKLQDALDGVLNNCYASHEFKAYTNVDNQQAGLFYKRKNPIDAFLDPEEGICAKFDVSLVRDNYDLYFLHDPGLNRGVRIEYAKNMLGVEFTDSDDEIATRIVPVGKTKDDKDLLLTDDGSADYIDSPLINDYPVIHITELECENCKVGEEEEEAGKVTAAIARKRMKAQAQKMIDDGCDKPKVEMSVEFLNLGDTEEYKQFKDLENCFLFDYIVVQHPDLMIDVTAQIVKIEWDCISDRMNSVEIGSLGETLANTGITSWQIPSGFSGSKIADGTLGGGALSDGIISARHVQADSINTEALQAGSVTTDKLAAGSITADKLDAGAINTQLLTAVEGIIQNLKAGTIEADELTARFAEFATVVAGTATFDRETVQHLVAEAMHLSFGEADSVFIQNLMVTYAQFAAATIGDLVVKASDGKYYHLDVNPTDGTVTATPADVTEGDITSGHTTTGETIIDTNILAENLSTANLFATYALINQIDAARIDVDQLFAREAFLDLLWTSQIHGDESIEFWAHNSVNKVVTEYCISDSPSMVTNEDGWSEEYPKEVLSNQYIWRRLKAYKGSGQYEVTSEECITLQQGAVGPQGVGIESVEEFYGLSASSAAQPSEWTSEPQPPTPELRYLWNKETIHYTDKSSQEGQPHIIGVFGEDGKIGRGIEEIINYYLASSESSGVTRQTEGWSKEMQATSDEKRYLWNYEETVWSDGSEHTFTNPIIIGTQGVKGDPGPQGNAGEQGIQGPPGPEGKSSYFHIKYSAKENPTSSADMTEEASTYIGTYVDFTEADSNDPFKYKWQRLEGAQGKDGKQGIPGDNGVDGKTSYLHIKYSDDGKTFTANDGEDPGDWIGQYVDFTLEDSTNFNDYKWSKIKGEQGQPGLQGLQGEKGEDGIPGPQGDPGSDGSSVNLILNSGVKYENSQYNICNYTLSEPFELNQQYTLTLWGALREDTTGMTAFVGDSSNAMVTLKPPANNGVYTATFTKPSWLNGKAPADTTKLLLYVYPNDGKGVTSRIDRIKLEKGSNSNPTWTANPKD